jgi:DNA (cytosine-5)-methyltransferase 3A
MNVLSLFDGISCGRVALERAGIKVDNYYASEIDKHAIKVTQHNYPDTIQLGDVTKIDFNQFIGKIDLLIGGSPCTNLSVAGNGKGLEGNESRLFYNYLDALKKIQPKYFLLENVKMKKVWEDIITDFLGVQPVEINSSLVSAQNRRRLYWTNIPISTLPEDKGILLKDIVHEYADNMSIAELEQYVIEPKRSITILEKETEKGKIGYIGSDSQGNRIYNIHGKSVTLVGNAGGLGAKTGLYLFGCITPDRINKRQNGQRFNNGEKFYTLTAQDKHGVLLEGYIRKLTPIECERLQNLSDNYTSEISASQRYKCLGNGWTVDVISHIFKGLKTSDNGEICQENLFI